MINLNEFCANENIISSIKQSIKSKRLLNSYIISGEKGTGKLTLAKILAKIFLCTTPNAENLPCGNCKSCRKIDSGNHPDVIYIKPEDNKKQISLSQIRSLCSDAYIKPEESEYKIYIIRNGEAMSALSQNALLKIFEQPPNGTVIIILTADLNIMLPTIISRAAVLKLSVPSFDQSLEFIKKHYDFDDTALKNSLEITHNNIGKTLSILKNDETCENYRILAENYFVNILKNESLGLLYLKEHIKNLDMFNLFINDFKNMLKDIILYFSDNDYICTADINKFPGINIQKLFLIIELIDKFIYNNNIYVNFNLCINYFNLKMREVLV